MPIELSFDEEDKSLIPSNKPSFYKAEKGRVDVLSLVAFRTLDDAVIGQARKKKADMSDEEADMLRSKWLAAEGKKKGRPLTMLERCGDFSSPKLLMFDQYWNESLKILAVRDPACNSEEDDKVWNRLAEPQTKIVTVVVQWPTTSDGDIDQSRIKNYRVLPWKFGPNFYRELARLDLSAKKDGSRLGHKDIQIVCKDTNFQNNTPSLFGKATWRSLPQEDQEKILYQAHKIITSPAIYPAKVMTTAELREKMGLKEATTVAVSLNSGPEEDDIISQL